MTATASTSTQSLARALEQAGFEVEVIGFNPILWHISLNDTCFQAIPAWNGVDWDLFLQLTPSAVHDCDWHRQFQQRLADSLKHQYGSAPRHSAPSGAAVRGVSL